MFLAQLCGRMPSFDIVRKIEIRLRASRGQMLLEYPRRHQQRDALIAAVDDNFRERAWSPKNQRMGIQLRPIDAAACLRSRYRTGVEIIVDARN